MDDFGIDLDKVLDDFERSEGGSSATRTESEHNQGNNLPTLQPQVPTGSVYTSPQVTPLPPAYTPISTSNSNYRQLSPFTNQYDISYDPQARVSDYAMPPPNNSIIHTIGETDRSGDIIPTSKPSLPGQLDLMVTNITLPHPHQHHNNQQWTGVNNNPMAMSYQYPTGVLAHGERSNSNLLRRLSDDRPELLQSSQEKPTSLPPYPGDVTNINQLAYPGGVVTSHTRPDVVPVSLNNPVDMGPRRPSGIQLQLQTNDLGVNYSCPNDVHMNVPSLNKTLHSSPVTCLSNGDLRVSLSQQDIPQQTNPVQVLQQQAIAPQQQVLPPQPQSMTPQGIKQQTISQQQQPMLKEQGMQKQIILQVAQEEATPQQMALPQVTEQPTLPQPHQSVQLSMPQEQTVPQVTQQTIPQQVTQHQTTPQQQEAVQQAQQPIPQLWESPQCVTPQPLDLPGVSQQRMSQQGLSLNLNPSNNTSLQPAAQKDAEEMTMDSTPHGLQCKQGDESTTEMIQDIETKPGAPTTLDFQQKSSQQRLDQNTSPNEHNNSEVVSPSIQCSNSVSPLAGSEPEKDGPEGQSEAVIIGFGDMEEEDITDDDMDAYLATLEAIDSSATAPSTVTQSKPAPTPNSLQFDSSSENNQLLTEQPAKSLETPDPPSYSDIQGNGGNVEKFLAPSIMSPRIATPMEDPGFSKVPGYMPTSGMSSLQKVETLQEEDEEVEEDQGGVSCAGTSLVGQIGPGQSSTAGSTPVPNVMSVTAPQCMSEHMQNVPQIETDCVMTMESLKGDRPSTAVGLGAITVSFPIREKTQPMDTSSGDVPDAANPMAGSGARPKENTTQRKSRPNSLLGLSKPDLNITVPVSSAYEMHDSGYSETGTPGQAGSGTDQMVENSHDIINRQLAQKARSPLQKKQLNLEIKQHLDNAAAARQMESSSTEAVPVSQTVSNGAASAVAGISVVTNRAQLASGVGLNLPSEGSPMLRHDSAPAGGEDVISSSSSSSLLSIQQVPSPARAAHYHPAAVTAAPMEASANEQPWTQQQEQEQEELGAEGECEQSAVAKLKRPTSLNLMPRSDFQVAGDKDSTEDDSVTGDGRYASSGSSGGHLTPFTTENEMSEPVGAMASGGPEMLYSPPEVGPGAFSPTPRCSSNSSVAVTQLGRVAPRWVPDAEACNCMQCEARFTFTKRRHHCRACGKVFCSTCCNLKCKLQYMDNKEARVCSKCYQDIVRAQAYERMHSPNRSPNPNNPAEYCSTIPPLQQAASSLHAPPPVVMVPVGVLRKEGSQRSREPKQVMFSDGIRPGGDLTELDGSDARLPLRRHSRSSKKVERLAAAAAATDSSSEATSAKSPSPKMRVKQLSEPSLRHACLIPDVGLPPVIMSTGVKGDFTLEEDPNPESMMPKIRSTEDPNPVVFAINKNLFVLVKIVNLDCCLNRVCWCFSTKGMCTVGQDEVVLVLECLPDEKTVPRDIFCHLNSVYDEASKGNTVSHLGHTIFGQSFLGSRDHCGFLYVRPTFQCVQKLLLPQPPYVFGLLLQKWETPWAKVFPIRLMLRLGAEYRYYPCPLISVRFRKPVYGEIGHTIMNLLADFRNYQYMLPQIRGVVVHMEEKKTFIKFPRNRYDEVMKVITNSNDHVMALGANFSTDADSHLVCIQNEDGNYQTQAINIQNKPRKVTGASFVVFNGALKTSSGLRAKSSIVEDGLMVQITSEAMGQLKAAMLDMKDYTISCGALDQPTPDEQVIVQWVEDDHKVNQGVKSPIDGLPMDGIESIHIHNGTDYVGETRTIRWTEVFFIQNEDSSNSRGEPVDLSRLAETLAGACCIALTPHLDKLRESGLTKLGLRCTIDRDRVGYEVGANSERLPDNYMNDLDNELIPVIHNAGSQSQDGPVVLELIFYIIE